MSFNFKGLIFESADEAYKDVDINEASFSKGKLEKVAGIYGRIMGKTLGGEFKVLGTENYSRTAGAGSGVRTMNNKGYQLRFNYDYKLAKYAKYDLTSIDYWSNDNRDFERPTWSIILHPSMNVVDIANSIANSFKSGKLVEAEDVQEARTGKELKSWLGANDLPTYLSSNKRRDSLLNKAREVGIIDELEMFLGEPETNSLVGDIKKQEKAVDTTVYADPETVFEDIESLLSLVAAGKWRTLIVCGQGGIGKCVAEDLEINFKGL